MKHTEAKLNSKLGMDMGDVTHFDSIAILETYAIIPIVRNKIRSLNLRTGLDP